MKENLTPWTLTTEIYLSSVSFLKPKTDCDIKVVKVWKFATRPANSCHKWLESEQADHHLGLRNESVRGSLLKLFDERKESVWELPGP